MKLEYTNRATSDLERLSVDNKQFGEATTAALEECIHQVIARIVEFPKAAEPVAQRPDMHVVPLVRYPYKIFYRIFEDRVLILHIRHSARKSWTV
jgi:plasmid stabilization system protein ParE